MRILLSAAILLFASACTSAKQVSPTERQPLTATERSEAMLLLEPAKYAEAYNAYTLAYFTVVGSCMRSNGFAYVDELPKPLPQPIVDSRANREKRGFGWLPPVGGLDEFEGAAPESPNQLLFAELAPAEQEASAAQFQTCSQQAEDQTDHTRPGAVTSNSVREALRDAEEWGRAQPEYLEASTKWAACMRDAGYEFDSSIAATESIISAAEGSDLRDRWAEAVYENSFSGAEPPLLSEVFSSDEIDTLRRLQDAEVRLATADWDCGASGKTVLDRLMNDFLLEE